MKIEEAIKYVEPDLRLYPTQHTPPLQEAYKTLLSFAEDVMKWKGKMPEKNGHDHTCDFDCKGCVDSGWNQAIDKCASVYAGLKQKLRKAEAKIKELESFKAKYFSSVEGVRYSQIIELEQENVRLRAKNRDLEAERGKLSVDSILNIIFDTKRKIFERNEGKVNLTAYTIDDEVAKAIYDAQERV